MARHFYRGRRVEHISEVYATDTGSKKANAYPTTVRMSNGSEWLFSGSVDANIAAIERMLDAKDQREHELANRQCQITVLDKRIADAKETLASIERIIDGRACDDTTKRLALVLRKWADSGRNYLRTEETAVVREFLASFKEGQ